MNTSDNIVNPKALPTKIEGKAERSAVFASPPLVEGEDHKLHHEFAANVLRAVKPRDFIEELLVQDVIDLSWEIRRMRRYKDALLSAWAWRGVEQIAVQELDEAEAQALARDWAASYPEDMETVKNMLDVRALPYETLPALGWAERIGIMARIEDLITNAERRSNDALPRRRLARWGEHRKTVAAAAGSATSRPRSVHVCEWFQPQENSQHRNYRTLM
jgi:hypothetical protein